jgi:hypothetical protein
LDTKPNPEVVPSQNAAKSPPDASAIANRYRLDDLTSGRQVSGLRPQEIYLECDVNENCGTAAFGTWFS